MPSKKRADDAIPAGFPAQRQDPPGLTSLMRPQPDHGEQSYQGTGKLEGRHALVTGGDSGIGRAVALAYAREGADVAFTYLPEEEPDAQVTVELVTSTGRGAVPIETDLTSREGCDAAVRQTVAALGAIDILVNNAGYQQARDKSVERMSDERFDRVLRTNLYALLWTIRAALPHMPRGSCIINTSSTQAYHPSRPLLDYAATKAAINNLTVNLAADLGPGGSGSTPSRPARSGRRCSPRPNRQSTCASSAPARPWAGPASRPRSPRPTCSWPARPTRRSSRARCSG